MKLKQVITLLLLIITNYLVAQNDTLKTKFIKIFSNATYYEYTSYVYFNSLSESSAFASKNVDFSFGFISISFEKFFKNGNSHELEILPFKINYEKFMNYSDNTMGSIFLLEAAKTFTFETSIRYQYNLNIIKYRNKTLNPYCGFSSNIFYIYKTLIPVLPTFYMQKNHQLGVGFYVIPSISYKINNKFLVDFNIPVCIGDIYYEKIFFDKPTLPNSSKSKSKIEINELPVKYFLRLGLTIKI